MHFQHQSTFHFHVIHNINIISSQWRYQQQQQPHFIFTYSSIITIHVDMVFIRFQMMSTNYCGLIDAKEVLEPREACPKYWLIVKLILTAQTWSGCSSRPIAIFSMLSRPWGTKLPCVIYSCKESCNMNNMDLDFNLDPSYYTKNKPSNSALTWTHNFIRYFLYRLRFHLPISLYAGHLPLHMSCNQWWRVDDHCWIFSILSFLLSCFPYLIYEFLLEQLITPTRQ